MKSVLTPTALLIALILIAPAAIAADAQTAASDTKMAVPPPGLGSDTLAVLVSDTTFGPDDNDADAAARYYCANRGKVALLIGKDRPMEFRSQVLQQWSVLTFRCVVPGQTN